MVGRVVVEGVVECGMRGRMWGCMWCCGFCCRCSVSWQVLGIRWRCALSHCNCSNVEVVSGVQLNKDSSVLCYVGPRKQSCHSGILISDLR